MAALIAWSLHTGQELVRFSVGNDNALQNFLASRQSRLPYDAVAMATDEDEILIHDVAKELQLGVAFLSGGKSNEGFPIITMPECLKFDITTDDEFIRLLTYLIRIPSYFAGLNHSSMLDMDKGFVILVDRRNESWNAVKSALVRIAQGYFPGIIQGVYVLKPKSFFQKKLSDFRFRFSKEEFKFQVLLLDSVKDLHALVHPTQLTKEFEGSICFDLTSWIEDRMAIERFANNCRERSTAVQILTDEFARTELPNDVEGANTLLMDHRKKRMELKDDLQSAMKYGQTLLRCMRRPLDESPDQNPHKVATLCGIERLLVQMEETEEKFEEMWTGHEHKLIQCLKLRKFEEDFKEAVMLLENLSEKLSASTDRGSSMHQVESLIKFHDEFTENSQDSLENAKKIHDIGTELIEEDHDGVDSIKPKCAELKRQREELAQRLESRKVELNRSLELHKRIDKAQMWCADGMKLLASQEMDKCQSKEGAEQYLQAIQNCLKGAKELKLSDPKEFRGMFSDILTSESKEPDYEAIVHEAVTKMEDVKMMFEKRQESLQKVIAKCERPVQIVPATPVPAGSRSRSPGLSLTSANGSPNETRKPKNKKVKGYSAKAPIPFPSHQLYVPMPFQSDKKIEILRGDSPDLGVVVNTQNGDSGSLSAKRRHVMKELIETEKMYVNELCAVLRGYIQEMENPDLMPFIPEALQGHRDILFSNWAEIYKFHSSTFLVELESYINTPTLIGKCFVKRKEELDSLYSTYCQNKPRSEILRRECGNNNPFFQECQRLLGHKLPLSAYLLKPVQRITKYQLLLREMLKYSSLEPGAEDLKTALDCMLTVIKYVNDTMHQVAITGFEGKLSNLGKLLMQGALYMWVDHKKRNYDIRQKKMQRHVFLYEKMVLFCKKRGDIKEKTCYGYKSSLKTAGIGLTEHVKGDKRKFEMWSGGRVNVYTFQAPSESEKMAWVKATRQALLQSQQLEVTAAGRPVQKPHTLESSPTNESTPANGGPLPSPTASDTSSTGYGSANPSLASEQSLECEEDENEEGWVSGEFSESDDETLEDRRESPSPQPVNQYVVLAEYNVVEEGEMAVKVNDIVNVQKVESSDKLSSASKEPQAQVATENQSVNKPESQPQPTKEDQPLTKPEPQPQSMSENQSLTKSQPLQQAIMEYRAVTKPQPQLLSSSENRPSTKPEPHSKATMENQPTTKPEPQPQAMMENQSLSKPESKPQVIIENQFLSKPQPQSMMENQSMTKPEPQPQSMTKPELQPQSITENQSMTKTEPQAQCMTENKSLSQPEPQPQSMTKPELQPQSITENQSMTKPKPQSMMENQSMTKTEPQPQSMTKPERQPQSITENQSMTKPEPKPQSMMENQSMTKTEPQPQSMTKPERQPQSITENQSMTKPEPQQQSMMENQSLSKPEPQPQSMTKPEPQPQSMTKPEPQPQSMAKTELQSQSIMENQSMTKPEPKPQSMMENESLFKPEPQPQSMTKPEPQLQSMTKPEVQSQSRMTNQPITKPPSAMKNQSMSKPQPKPRAIMEDQPTTKSEPKPKSMMENQSLSKPQPHNITEDQPTTKPVLQPQLQSKPQSMKGNQPTTKPHSMPQSMKGNQPTTTLGSQPLSVIQARPTTKPQSKPQSKKGNQAMITLESQPLSLMAAQPTTKPQSKPQSMKGNQATTKPQSKPQSMKGNQAMITLESQPLSLMAAQPTTKPQSKPQSKKGNQLLMTTLEPQPLSVMQAQPTTKPQSKPPSLSENQPRLQFSIKARPASKSQPQYHFSIENAGMTKPEPQPQSPKVNPQVAEPQSQPQATTEPLLTQTAEFTYQVESMEEESSYVTETVIQVSNNERPVDSRRETEIKLPEVPGFEITTLTTSGDGDRVIEIVIEPETHTQQQTEMEKEDTNANVLSDTPDLLTSSVVIDGVGEVQAKSNQSVME
ncbi:guanine nucleotide exchange factor DBS-like [Patiria miniata]|uniref:Guanine nucleotide exchange factor DBS-like n=1 Tax=Patiria miniata TaxID=46514 RepID=A0A913ZGT2_PATMI|nr:guanine nucleotide exchange factor DBS-like [Patiria miniata]